MYHKRILKITTIVVLLAALGSFGAIFATTNSESNHTETQNITEQTLGSRPGRHNYGTPMARWESYGVLSYAESSESDGFVTYNQFASVMENLLGYTIDERYTYKSGNMYISSSYSFAIISQALGKDIPIPDSIQNDHLTFIQLAEFMDSLIQVYITDQSVIDLQDIYLDGTIVINSSNSNRSTTALNIHGSGDILVVPNRNGQLLFDNIHISGNIIISQSAFSQPMGITLNNSTANSIKIIGESSVSLINRTQIDNIYLYSPSEVNISLLANWTPIPNIIINSPHVSLIGEFNFVENTLNNDIIFIDGSISTLHTNHNLVLVGTGEIEHTISPHGVFAYVIDPNCNLGSHYSNVISHIDYALENMLYTLGNMIDEALDPPAQTPVMESFPSIIIPRPPITNPGGDNDNGFVPGEDYTGIQNINFELMPPNLLPAALLPDHLESNVQRTIIGDGFTGTVLWEDINGSPLIGDRFAHNVIYIATITLTANDMYYFYQSPDVHISTHNVSNTTTDAYGHDRIIFTLTFNILNRQPADAFFLRAIEGSFNQIHVYTHYLGRLMPENFNITFNHAAVNITGVSSFNHNSGYYVITLAQTLHPNGSTLSVNMVDGPSHQLSYHEPYAANVEIVPQPSVPTLITTQASPGDFISAINFPLPCEESNTFPHIFLSTERWNGYDDKMIFALSGMYTRPFDPVQQGFYLHDHTPLGSYYVYIFLWPTDLTPGSLMFVGELNVS